MIDFFNQIGGVGATAIGSSLGSVFVAGSPSPSSRDLFDAGEAKGRQIAIATARDQQVQAERNLNSLFAVNNVLAAQNGVQTAMVRSEQLRTTYAAVGIGAAILLGIFLLRK